MALWGIECRQREKVQRYFGPTCYYSGVKLPDDAVVAPEKITRYLLVWRCLDDKSAYLAKGGYSLFNPEALLLALTKLGKEDEARPLGWNHFGCYYEVRGILPGAFGIRLQVRTTWMTELLSGITKFITLIPVGVLK